VLPVQLFFAPGSDVLIAIGTDDAVRRWHVAVDWRADKPYRTGVGITADIGENCLVDSGLPLDRRLTQTVFDAKGETMVAVDRHLDCAGHLMSVWTLLSKEPLDKGRGDANRNGPSDQRAEPVESYYFRQSVDRVAFSANGSYIITAPDQKASDKTAHVWQARSSSSLKDLDGYQAVSELCRRVSSHFSVELKGTVPGSDGVSPTEPVKQFECAGRRAFQ
jgi:hypothetical protein